MMNPTAGNRKTAQHFAGCLLGGAVGDALGGPTEFLSLEEIRRRWGPEGQRGYVERNASGLAEFTDDTQMTLFTAEGLLNTGEIRPGSARAVQSIWQSYQNWLRTQEESSQPGQPGLLSLPELWKQKAPGNTCLSALRRGIPGSPENPPNNSKGCGGVMRVAPAGLLYSGPEAFRIGVMAAALTHGHPTGYLAAGVLAETIAGLAEGLSIRAAVEPALVTLTGWKHHEETYQAVQQALVLADDLSHPPGPESVERLGAGWIAEEALAVGLYCALVGERMNSFRGGVLLAVNHSGDNDSTASITGNLLGLLLGKAAIPPEWLSHLELRAEIEAIAHRLYRAAQAH